MRINENTVAPGLSEAGALGKIEEPTGGYNGLRRQANCEAIGHDLRVPIANVSDLVRNLECLGREFDTNRTEQLRTIVDLERTFLGWGRTCSAVAEPHGVQVHLRIPSRK
jgi:hypothetical protein